MAEAVDHRRTLKRRLMGMGRAVLDRINSGLARRSPIGDRPFFTEDAFPWVARVEADWHEIRAELEEVLTTPEQIPEFATISKDQAHLAQPGKWQTFFLYAYGYRADQGCERCPRTAAIVEHIPGMKTSFFSILQPHMRIAPHRGPYKGLVRYHLGLVVPSTNPDDCGIRVEREVRTWREGGSLLFDDTYEHEAWNETGSLRAVLFVDVERPLPPLSAILNRALIRVVGWSPLVQDGIRNYEDWTERQLS